MKQHAKELPSKACQIAVAGDVCLDVVGVPKQRPGTNAVDSDNWRLTGEVRTCYLRGGALLLTDMIKDAVGDPASVSGPLLKTPAALSCGKPPAILDNSLFARLTREEIIHSLITVGEFKTSAKSGKEDKTLRVSRTHGFSGPSQGNPTLTPTPSTVEEGSLLVLDDTGNQFRKDGSQWEVLLQSKPCLIINKLHRPLPLSAEEASPGTTLWGRLMMDHPGATVVVVSADDLRMAGAVISRQLSWERTARELLWHLLSCTEFKELRRSRWLVVRFGLDGALCWHQATENVGAPRAWLVYDPRGIENQFAWSVDGEMVGYGSAFVAGLVKALAADPSLPDQTAVLPQNLCDGIKFGLQAARQLLTLGYGKPTDQPTYPTGAMFEKSDEAKEVFYSIGVPVPEQKTLADPVGNWTILGELLPGGNDLYRAAADLAVHKKPPAALAGVPMGSFGTLTTYDREEIEGYRAISNLMREYLSMSAPKRPLCFAVFGPPGAGKSFGVKQVAKSVVGGTIKLEELVFNLAQFRSPDELIPALHRVRDEVLKGKVPLVFFDEFDAALEGHSLYWLKYLLAPMQDGEFVERGVAHPIGKAIFVFAGGTSYTYKDFIVPSKAAIEHASTATHQHKEAQEAFRTAKGKDFVSRLRGFLDIRGTDHDEGYRGPTLLRRASALRYQLGEKAPHLFDGSDSLHIDPGVLRAFLEVRAYEHGIRSLEALVDMSLLAGRDSYEPGCLPSPAQVALHVTPKQTNEQPGMGFLDLLYADSPWPSQQIRERIAQEIHRLYLEDRKKPGGGYNPNKASHKDWDDLSELYRDSNRAQADDIPRKLRLMELDWLEAKDAGDRTFITEQDLAAKDYEQRVNKAACAEHERWMAERRRQGWVFGPQEDAENRIHPDMQDWDRLNSETKDKDLSSIRALPRLLKAAGCVVVNGGKPKANTMTRNSQPLA